MKDNECKAYADTSDCKKSDCRDCNRRFLRYELKQRLIDERENAIDEFAEQLCINAESFEVEVDGQKMEVLTLDYLVKLTTRLAEKLKCEK